MKRDHPEYVLADFAELHPGCFERAARCRARLMKGTRLENWCYMPIPAARDVLNDQKTIATPELQHDDVLTFTALSGWYWGKGFYVFDEILLDSVIDTEVSSQLPADVLKRLPEWSVYVDTRRVTSPSLSGVSGFWYTNTLDTEGFDSLLFVMNIEGELIPMYVRRDGSTLIDCIEATLSAASLDSEEEVRALRASLSAPLSLVLFLCSDEPEIEDERRKPPVPKNRPEYHASRGLRYFPRKHAHKWIVGRTAGNSVRNFHKSRRGGARAAHLRRAHWHGVWRGPRDGEQTFHYNWLPPTFVRGVKPK